MYLKVFFQRLLQHIRAAIGERMVQAGIAVAGNAHITVPQERGQINGLCLLIDGYKDHSIRTANCTSLSGVRADQKDIIHIIGNRHLIGRAVRGDVLNMIVPLFQLRSGSLQIVLLIRFVQCLQIGVLRSLLRQLLCR